MPGLVRKQNAYTDVGDITRFLDFFQTLSSVVSNVKC